MVLQTRSVYDGAVAFDQLSRYLSSEVLSLLDLVYHTLPRWSYTNYGEEVRTLNVSALRNNLSTRRVAEC